MENIAKKSNRRKKRETDKKVSKCVEICRKTSNFLKIDRKTSKTVETLSNLFENRRMDIENRRIKKSRFIFFFTR